MHGQLRLVVAGLALAVEEQHGQRCAGDEQAVEPAVEEFKLQLPAQHLGDHAPAQQCKKLGRNK